jgi:hypothetical protein
MAKFRYSWLVFLTTSSVVSFVLYLHFRFVPTKVKVHMKDDKTLGGSDQAKRSKLGKFKFAFCLAIFHHQI